MRRLSRESHARAVDADRRDQELCAVIDTLTRRLQAGEAIDLDAAVREHPQLADELRELWGAVVLTEGIARGLPPDGSSTVTVAATGTQPQRPGTAPFQAPAHIGEFEIVREIGRGGMGVVYEARQPQLDRRVALKILLQREFASNEDLARFRAEAEAAARLDHPNIVPVFEVGTHENMPFFTLRFIEGDTLAHRLASGPMSPRRAAELLIPICDAVDYAHRRGVLHRDLKPSNILIDRAGLPHITDFGLAKRLKDDSSLTQSGAILGTPGYMAPEQAAGNRGVVSARSDVYSLGALLYHMVTGRAPFQASTPVDTVLAVLEKDPISPRELNPAIDRELEMIILKCLQKPTELRYESAAALRADLHAYIEGGALSVKSVSLALLFSRMLRSTHHAGILEDWGLLWMLHSVVLLVLCVLTNLLGLYAMATPLACLSIWTLGFGAWAAFFWSLRRRGGPITFVERQIAHVWGGSILASSALFVLEIVMGIPPLTLSPVLAVFAGMVFLAKAAILSGSFYLQSMACFATAFVMALVPDYGLTVFGIVVGASFFIPGLKYYLKRSRASTSSSRLPASEVPSGVVPEPARSDNSSTPHSGGA